MCGAGAISGLLVPPLDRAIALEQMDGVALGVGEDLHLDVPRASYGLLNERSRVAECAFCLAHGRSQGFPKHLRVIDSTHTAAAAPAAALTNTGKPISSAPATSSSMFAEGGVDEGGNASSLGCLRARTLLPASSRTPAGGPMKMMPASAQARARSGFSLRTHSRDRSRRPRTPWRPG